MQPSLNQTVNFTIVIPGAAAGASSRRYIRSGVYLSPNTGSISLRLVAVNGVSLVSPPASTVVNVPASCRDSAAGCTLTANGVPAAVGSDQFTVATFTAPGAGGSVISNGVVVVTVTGGVAGTASVGGSTQLTLGGYVASLAVTVTPSALPAGTPGTATIVVAALDAAGATIVGNTQFAFPITLAVSASGYTLGGPGLQSNGTILLTGPQTTPNSLAYNGTAAGSTLTASSQSSSGATVSVSVPIGPVVVVTPTPSITPTSAPPPTLPPITPTPVLTPTPFHTPTPVGATPTPTPTPAPAASSLFVLNAYDNSIAEFTQPVITGSTQYLSSPRRVFGGADYGCPPNPTVALAGVLGIAQDAGANIWGATDGSECTPNIDPTMWEFSPAAVGSAPPTTDSDISYDGTEFLVGLGYDAANNSMWAYNSPNVMLVDYALSGGVPLVALGADDSSGNNCLISAGLPNSTPTTPCYDPNGGFMRADTQNGFAVAPNGEIYIVADDVNGTDGSGFIIMSVSPANQVAGSAVLADPAWIEGPMTKLGNSYPAAIAVDAANNLLWVFDAQGDGVNGRLLAYNLAGLAGQTGPVNLKPVTVLGGLNPGRLPANTINLTGSILEGLNSIWVSNGLVFVASTVGPVCDTTCQNGAFDTPGVGVFAGEVDVYNESTTGSHGNGDPLSAPVAVYYGLNVASPVGVVAGPHGTGIGTSGLHRMPATRYVNPRLYDYRRRLRAQMWERLHPAPRGAVR